MDDLPNLVERASALRQRISAFLEQFGDSMPEVRQLHAEAERIEDCLKALGEELPDLNS